MSESPPRWQERVSVEPASGIVLSRHGGPDRLVDQEVGAGELRSPADPSTGVAATMEDETGARIEAPANESDPLPSLVTGAVSGDAKATRALLVAMGGQVRGACRAVMGSGHPDLEDTIQECFVGLIRALPAYRFEGAFPHYALRIAVRTALGARRRAQALRKREEPEATPGDEAPAPIGTPSEQVLTAERRELLRTLLDELPEVQAQSLIMRVLFDLSIEEIARAWGVSVNTVKTRLRLAKEALRRRIAADSKLSIALGGPR